MSDNTPELDNKNIQKVKKQFEEGTMDRRDFLRYSTLLGMSSAAAYAFVGKITGENIVEPALAAVAQGGDMKIGMRVVEVTSPHTFSWGFDSNLTRGTVEYLTETGADNVTRPYLCEKWEASDDLKTWTLHMRKGVKWHDGRAWSAADAAWNIEHCLNPATGSSVLGLMKGYMLNEIEVTAADGTKSMSTEIWSDNAIEVVDEHTLRLNCKEAQVAVPEHLFHYPFPMLDPKEGGVFGPGSNGTGAFDLVEVRVGERAVLKARSDYWGDAPKLDSITYIDLGDDPSAGVGALASKQIDALYEIGVDQMAALEHIPHVNIQQVTTAQTAVARVQVDRPEFSDPRVRKAMRLAIDTAKVLKIAHNDMGSAGEHHHVSPVHPDYKNLGMMKQDIPAAKALLAEAGHPDGVDFEIACKKDPSWEINAVQAMVEMWKAAGIRVKMNVLPSAQFWDTWDKVPFGFTEWTHRPLGFMVLGLAYRSGVPWNESHYANPEFDALLTKAEGTLDIKERSEILGQLQTIMQDDGPIIQPLWRPGLSATTKDVAGWDKHPTDYVFPGVIGFKS